MRVLAYLGMGKQRQELKQLTVAGSDELRSAKENESRKLLKRTIVPKVLEEVVGG